MNSVTFKVGQVVSCWDIVTFVKSIHYNEQDFCDGDIAERIKRFGQYELQEVPIDKIHKNGWYTDEENVIAFSQMNIDTFPPVVLDEEVNGLYGIVDGNHRIQSHILRGLTSIKAFVPILESKLDDED